MSLLTSELLRQHESAMANEDDDVSSSDSSSHKHKDDSDSQSVMDFILPSHHGGGDAHHSEDDDDAGSCGTHVSDDNHNSGVKPSKATPKAPPQSANIPCWYFAYGSNMNVAQLIDRVGSYKERRLMRLDRYRICFNKIAYVKSKSLQKRHIGFANIVPDTTGVVYGIAYLLQENQIGKMDKYEVRYSRELLQCYDDSTRSYVPCWVYIALPDAVSDNLMPTDTYMSNILGGRGVLPASYVDFLQKFETMKQDDASNFF